MNKTHILSVMALLIVSSLGFASATAPLCNNHQGAIWTTTASCGDPQNSNLYNIGDKVFINGDNFCPDVDHEWSITGKPGGASEDPDAVVASGINNSGADGSFCFEAYIIQNDDGGEYGVNYNGKNDNYRVMEDVPVVPEFGLIAGALTIMGAVGLMFLVRRK